MGWFGSGLCGHVAIGVLKALINRCGFLIEGPLLGAEQLREMFCCGNQWYLDIKSVLALLVLESFAPICARRKVQCGEQGFRDRQKRQESAS